MESGLSHSSSVAQWHRLQGLREGCSGLEMLGGPRLVGFGVQRQGCMRRRFVVVRPRRRQERAGKAREGVRQENRGRERSEIVVEGSEVEREVRSSSKARCQGSFAPTFVFAEWTEACWCSVRSSSQPGRNEREEPRS